MFIIAFLSATILPMGSEAVLIYYLQEHCDILILFLAATIGNSAGSLTNYFIGYKGEEYLESKGYLNSNQIDKYKALFARYGFYTLLLSWVPIIGDPLTIIAGAMRYNILKFITLIILAKGGRYAIVILLWI
jgi:membrane protein YqaA with SNARE-associated domain